MQTSVNNTENDLHSEIKLYEKKNIFIFIKTTNFLLGHDKMILCLAVVHTFLFNTHPPAFF